MSKEEKELVEELEGILERKGIGCRLSEGQVCRKARDNGIGACVYFVEESLGEAFCIKRGLGLG